MKLYIIAQNVAAHLEFDWGKRDEQTVSITELNRTIREKSRVEEKLKAARGSLLPLRKIKKNLELSSADRLAGQRVEGYFHLIDKVGEKYPSLDWSFLDDDAKETQAGQGEGSSIEVVAPKTTRLLEVPTQLFKMSAQLGRLG
ncbi:hypothetical protein L3X38_024783 [Prunus dulcis]|uniref:Uncharacterized protein n=1 Tax=Prunus dulcis TaxID=3755 RepID=A0AAD4W0E8_PRUDU|nr:hypothetical protein L3X38_024783 [Prunus dulcis]